MPKLELFKNILVFCLVYFPPMLVFQKYWISKGKNKIIIVAITVAYLIFTVYIQNFVPFIFVIIDIILMRFTDEFEVFEVHKFKILKALKAVVFSYLVIILIVIAQTFAFNIFNLTMKQQDVVKDMVSMSYRGFILMIPVAVVFAPVLEEFVFRWFFFKKIFSKKFGVYAAAIISSFMFSLLHFSFTAFFIIFWIGMYNCYLVYKKGYWYAVFNHAVFNFIAVMGMLYQRFI